MIKHALFIAILPTFLLCSCNGENNFDNTLPYNTFEINYVVDEETNKVEMQCDFDIESSNIDLFDSTDNNKEIDSLIGGDVLTIY